MDTFEESDPPPYEEEGVYDFSYGEYHPEQTSWEGYGDAYANAHEHAIDYVQPAGVPVVQDADMGRMTADVDPMIGMGSMEGIAELYGGREVVYADMLDNAYRDDAFGGIEIHDQWDEDGYNDGPWLPYRPASLSQSPSEIEGGIRSSNGGGQQQVVVIPSFPDQGEMTSSYCRLHPYECRDGALPVEGAPQGNCSADANCTINGMDQERRKGVALGQIDMSGLGVVMLLLLMLFVGLHFGSDGEKKSSGGE